MFRAGIEPLGDVGRGKLRLYGNGGSIKFPGIDVLVLL